MNKIICLAFLIFIASESKSQFRLGVFGGIANYHGDLVSKPFQSPKPVFGLTGTYEISQRFNIRAGISFARVAGADSLSSSEALRARNLSFQSDIQELSLMVEYNVFNLEQVRWTPYFFAGFALFHFDPFTYDQSGEKVYLQKLTTEGQGIDGYGTEPYSRRQIAIPFGGGVKYALSDRFNIGIELGLRKLFTDYLDDVSGNYADPFDLFTARGPRSPELAFRGDELGVVDAPAKGEIRGSPKYKDYYYFTGLHLSFRLGGGDGGRNNGYGCPKVEY